MIITEHKLRVIQKPSDATIENLFDVEDYLFLFMLILKFFFAIPWVLILSPYWFPPLVLFIIFIVVKLILVVSDFTVKVLK